MAQRGVNNRCCIQDISVPSPMEEHVNTGLKVAKLATFIEARTFSWIQHQWIGFWDGKWVKAVGIEIIQDKVFESSQTMQIHLMFLNSLNQTISQGNFETKI